MSGGVVDVMLVIAIGYCFSVLFVNKLCLNVIVSTRERVRYVDIHVEGLDSKLFLIDFSYSTDGRARLFRPLREETSLLDKDGMAISTYKEVSRNFGLMWGWSLMRGHMSARWRVSLQQPIDATSLSAKHVE
jgi:hypothetical protein